VHVCGDVLAVHSELCASRGAEGSVQHSPVFGGVDVLAAEHRGDAVAQVRLIGEREQVPCNVVVHQVFRQIHPQARSVEGVALGALRIRLEQVSQCGAGLLRVKFFQRAPAFCGRDVVHVGLPGGGWLILEQR